MMTSYDSRQQQKQIDAAMALHVQTLRDAAFDSLSALLTIILGILSFIHAIVRVLYASIGMVVWTLGVWLIALQALRAQCIAHSATSPFRREVQDE